MIGRALVQTRLLRDCHAVGAWQIIAIIRRLWPRASDGLVDFLLWERTPWPLGGDIEDYERPLLQARANYDRGLADCEMCGKGIPRRWKLRLCTECARKVAKT